MMKNLFTNIIILFASLIFLSWDNFGGDANQSGAKIVFDEEMYDFGEVVSGTVVEHIFIFRNAGGDTLRIKRIDGG
ncbi:MAG: DUF1573 domain-containing protein [Calditrichaceae bacterium]